MAQPNVAREPSMEEILASIRRIIESNEPDARPMASDLPEHDEDDQALSETIGFVPEVVANDPGLPRKEPIAPMPTPSLDQQVQQPDRNMSLADVAARVRAAAARQQENGTVNAPDETASAAARRQEGSTDSRPPFPRMTEFRDGSAPLRTAAPVQAQPVAAAAPVKPREEPAGRAPLPSFDPPRSGRPEGRVREEARPSADTTASSLPAKIEEAANLLSAEAGAHVAKSFGDLAAVFNGIERRSLEEMAQEMLRPMLQEWLDDNLPTLVERLVREEIERVARGPRR